MPLLMPNAFLMLLDPNPPGEGLKDLDLLGEVKNQWPIKEPPLKSEPISAWDIRRKIEDLKRGISDGWLRNKETNK